MKTLKRRLFLSLFSLYLIGNIDAQPIKEPVIKKVDSHQIEVFNEAKPYLLNTINSVKVENVEKARSQFKMHNAYLTEKKIVPESILKEHLDIFIEAYFYISVLLGDEIGDIYQEDIKDLKKAIIPFLEYKTNERPRSQALLGMYYYHEGLGDNPPNKEKGKDLVIKAANKEEAFSMFLLGALYDSEDDTENAIKWLEKAALKNEALSQLILGHLYRIEYDDEHPDYRKKAIMWYEKAAEQDFVFAMERLGDFYFLSSYEMQDYSKAKFWYQKAADKGSDGAMKVLGYIYKDGLGVTQDYTKAKFWYQKAADKGNEWAMEVLGDFYKDGLGVTQDSKKAKFWYQKACDNDSTKACEKLKNL